MEMIMNKKLLVAGVAFLVTVGSAFAISTYTNTVGGLSGYALVDGNKVFVMQNTYTLSTSSTIANSNTVAMINIPSNTMVVAVELNITTATTNGVTTVDVGDSGSASRYISNADAATINTRPISAASTWDVKSANTEIALRFDHAPGQTGVFKVKAVVVNLN
jgi:hypothetical protein